MIVQTWVAIEIVQTWVAIVIVQAWVAIVIVQAWVAIVIVAIVIVQAIDLFYGRTFRTAGGDCTNHLHTCLYNDLHLLFSTLTF